jgi:MFS family permease
VAVASLFFLNGALFATWVSRIPAVQLERGLSHGGLGLALLAVALGAVVAMPLTGLLTARIGSDKVSKISALVYCVALLFPTLAPNATLFVVGLFLFGAFHGALALLTNASSVLALSTINRMLRTRDRMHDLFAKSEAGGHSEAQAARLVEQTNRVERQAVLLLNALRSIYVALSAFVSATLVTLLGAGLAPYQGAIWFRILVGLGVLLGFVGVGGIVVGSVNLFQATQLSLVNIREEAALIRERQTPSGANTGGAPEARQ